MAYVGGDDERSFDPSAWNLTAVGTAALLGGCGPTVLLGDTEGIADPTEGETDIQPYNDDAPLPTTDSPTTTSPTTTTPTGDCVYDSDCPNYYSCIAGSCEYYCLDCCGGECYYEEGPYYYECYGDEDCPPGELCNFSYGRPYCQPLPYIEQCFDQPSFIGLPIDIPDGDNIVGLAFVDVDPAAGDELLVSRADGAWLVRAGQSPAPLPVPADNFILHADAGDFLGNGENQIVAAFGPDGDFGVFAPDGMGGFSYLGTVASEQVNGLAALDFNGDTAADVALIVDDTSVVRLGLGDGTFASESEVWGGFSFRIDAGDLLGDALPDVVTSTDDGVKAVIGNLDGDVDDITLTSEYGFPTSSPMVVGDIAGNGIDAVFVFYRIGVWNLVRYFYNAAGDLAVVGPEVQIGTAADVDGDGGDDFVLYGDGAITFLQTGARDGPLQCSHFVDLLEPYTMIDGGDFNGDGVDEVVLAHASELVLYGVL